MRDLPIKNTELYEFWNSWKTANTKYQSMCPGNHLHFPEPLFKVIAKMIDPSLTEEGKNSYDFDGNIEVKSSTTKKGVTPFKSTQSNCKRILFFRIVDEKMEYYDITDKDKLKRINNEIRNSKNGNITLANYTDAIEPQIIVIEKE